MNRRQYAAIMKWKEITFPNSSVSSELKHLQSEVKELKEALAKKYSEKNWVEAEMELADCFFLLYGVASKLGLSYEDICNVIEIKFQENKKRKWGKPDKDGVVNHIK